MASASPSFRLATSLKHVLPPAAMHCRGWEPLHTASVGHMQPITGSAADAVMRMHSSSRCSSTALTRLGQGRASVAQQAYKLDGRMHALEHL